MIYYLIDDFMIISEFALFEIIWWFLASFVLDFLKTNWFESLQVVPPDNHFMIIWWLFDDWLLDGYMMIIVINWILIIVIVWFRRQQQVGWQAS